MARYDLFNGDADGLCSMVQLRLADPQPEAELITGVKRDISLVKRVPTGSHQVTVLDVSFDKNRDEVKRLLASGSEVFYSDHHNPGELIEDAALHTEIDTDAHICTGLIISRYLNKRYHLWAVTAAFGDNLNAVAETEAKALGLDEEQTSQLKRLGVCLNYNGYGAAVSDLHFDPAELFQELVKFESPFEFMSKNAAVWQKLSRGYDVDMAQGESIEPLYQDNSVYVVQLPNETWARRVSGVLGNQLANLAPARAHAVVTLTAKGNYMISVRAPLENRTGADELVGQFPTGGGRKAAAGINELPIDMLPQFIDAMKAQYR